MHQKKKRIAVITVIAIVLAVFFAMLLSIDKIQRLYLWGNIEDADRPFSILDSKEEIDYIYYDGKKYVLNENISTLLIIGIDNYGEAVESGSYNNSGRADFVMLAVFDNENKSYKLLHLNRDTMTEIGILGVDGRPAGKVNAQLALSYSYGSGLEDSCKNTASAVSGLLYGIQIDNYLSMTMDAVGNMNDMIGGVTLTVKDDFPDCEELKAGNTVTLDGELALKYVRGRMNVDDSTNLSRMERQRQYMDAFISAFRERIADDNMLVLNMYNEISEYIVTDLEVDQVSERSEQLKEYSYNGTLTTEGRAEKGEEYIEYYVNDDMLRQLVIDLFYLSVGENNA